MSVPPELVGKGFTVAERDWETASEPDQALAPESKERFSPRKLWLAGIACLRQVVPGRFDDWMSAIEAGEALLDAPDSAPKYWRNRRNWCPPRDRLLTQEAVGALLYHGLLRTPEFAMSTVKEAMWMAAQAATFAETGLEGFTLTPRTEKQRAGNEAWHRIRVSQTVLIRDIFGNPFRPISLDPSWRTPTVLALARQMYESRNFSPIPILADALQDAGCEQPDILAHCRDPGPHVRGCWAVDLVLGKM